jgi:hypothetical protein
MGWDGPVAFTSRQGTCFSASSRGRGREVDRDAPSGLSHTFEQPRPVSVLPLPRSRCAARLPQTAHCQKVFVSRWHPRMAPPAKWRRHSPKLPHILERNHSRCTDTEGPRGEAKRDQHDVRKQARSGSHNMRLRVHQNRGGQRPPTSRVRMRIERTFLDTVSTRK